MRLCRAIKKLAESLLYIKEAKIWSSLGEEIDFSNKSPAR